MEIKGKVSSGVGEGQVYVERYLPYLETTLGFTCYPGTLNIKVKKMPDFDGHEKMTITPKEEELVPVDCYLVRIAGQFDGAIVVPSKTTHGKDILEIVAPISLREELKLKDGDEVVCELV